MRSKLNRTSGLAAALTVMVSAWGSAAFAAPPVACKLLSPAEVGAAVGVAVAQGDALNTATVSSCSWRQGGVDRFKAVTVIVSVKSAQAFEMGRSVMAPTPVGGLGDAAYITGTSASYTVLSVKKGANAFTVTVRGLKDVAALQAAEKALGRTAVGRL